MIRCVHIEGPTVEESLEEFNRRAEGEFKISDDDILGLSAKQLRNVPRVVIRGMTKPPKVRLSVFYKSPV